MMYFEASKNQRLRGPGATGAVAPGLNWGSSSRAKVLLLQCCPLAPDTCRQGLFAGGAVLEPLGPLPRIGHRVDGNGFREREKTQRLAKQSIVA